VSDETKLVHVETTFKASYDVEVPVDWEWDGDLRSILPYDDLDSSTAELVDWEIRPKW
jgi:hypothetical protein